MSDIVYIVMLVALFVLYCIKFREKTVQFILGVIWFYLEIIRKVFTTIFFGSLVELKESSLNLYNFVNNFALVMNLVRDVECILLFCIVLSFFVLRRKAVKIITKIEE